MEFRFRYLGGAREEIEVGSVELLRELVKNGTVGETTMLFDALTKEWAPARAHAIYRFLRDEGRPGVIPVVAAPPPSISERPRTRARAPEEPAPLEASPKSGAAARSGDSFGLGLTFSIAEPESEPDADEEARQILRAREREGDAPAKPDAILQWSAANAASMMAKDLAARPEPWASPIPSGVVLAAAAHPASLLVTDHRPIVFMPPARSGPMGRVHDWLHELGTFVLENAGTRSMPRVLVLVGLIGLLLVLVASAGRGAPAVGGTLVSAAPISPEVTRLVTSLGPAQTSGFQNMVAGVDSLRRAYDIMAVPSIWLDGKYLSDAPSYPEVKDFWTRYQAFVSDVRAHDTTMYRAGFVEAMQSQGADGTMLTLRLSQAMRDFEKTQPQREEVYRHMEELSSAALQLHALLVDRAGDIKYAPAIQHGVSREPVVEAVAEDTVLHDHMWTLLDRIFASLEWIGGDLGASKDDLADKMLKGIQATAH